MPKELKGDPNRKPPEPSADHRIIDDWIGGLMPGMQPVVTRIDEVIREIHEDLRYGVKWSKAYYALPELGWVIELAGYHVSANIVFHGGGDFAAPPPLGTTGRTRYVKLRSIDEVDTDEVRGWIREAGTMAGWTG